MSIRLLVLLASAWLASAVSAAETSVSVPLQYGLIRSVLVNQLFTAEGNRARLWQDGKQCSFVDIANPQLSGDSGQVKIDSDVHARIGLQMGGKCIPALEWQGQLQTLQQPTLDASGTVLSFPVTRATAFDRNGQGLNIDQLQSLINQAVQPRLSALKIDLNDSRSAIVQQLLPFVAADDTEKLLDTVNSLRFKKVVAGDEALQIAIGMQPIKLKKASNTAVEALSDSEMQRWQTQWQHWQTELETGLSQPPLLNQSEDDKARLRTLFAAAGTAFSQALSQPIGKQDPVRQLFKQQWDTLTPLLHSAAQQLPGANSLRFLTLITATDLLVQLDAFAAPLGLDLSANGLRKVVRAYWASQGDGAG
jgi:hypothetical protein